MAKKKRAPIEQLREAGRVARQMLIDKGIHSKESVIDKIVSDAKAPMLPGIPAYLPHEWTIKATQRIMRDILVIWKEECGDDKKKANDITEFWKFIIKELHKQEKIFVKQEREMSELIKVSKEIPVLKDIFAPTRNKDNIIAINRFFVDSFAVGIVLKKNHSTSEYLMWFLDWTQDLHEYWIRPDKRKKIKRT
jgi:hypothetical protein